MEEITAVVLASGLGTRLKSLTEQKPKPLIQLGGKPLIEYTLTNLYKARVAQVVITTRPFSYQFPQKLSSEYRGMKLLYKDLSASAPLGTAGDLKAAEEMLPKNSPFFVCNSDIITNLDFAQLYQNHQASEASATISLIEKKQKDYPQSIGLGANGQVVRLHRNIYGKSVKDYTFACQHILTKDLLKHIPKNKPWGFFGDNDLYPTLIQKGLPINTFIYPPSIYWADVGTPDRLEKVQKDLATGRI